MNGLTLLALIALAIGVVVAWRAGVAHGRRGQGRELVVSPPPPPRSAEAPPPEPVHRASAERIDEERARLIRSYEAEAAALRGRASVFDAETARDATLVDEQRRLQAALAEARAESARYRQIVVDLENNAAPPLLDGPGSPDDLKLIVGIGPVLERMLYQLGIASYRQIARWTERDIDEFDAKLPEFPGRIRRDAWVIQARALHQSKYGDPPAARDHG